MAAPPIQIPKLVKNNCTSKLDTKNEQECPYLQSGMPTQKNMAVTATCQHFIGNSNLFFNLYQINNPNLARTSVLPTWQPNFSSKLWIMEWRCCTAPNTIKRYDTNNCDLKILVFWQMRIIISQFWLISYLTHKCTCTRTMFVYLLSGKQTGKSKVAYLASFDTMRVCNVCPDCWMSLALSHDLATVSRENGPFISALQSFRMSRIYLCQTFSGCRSYSIALSLHLSLHLVSLKQCIAKPSVVTKFLQSFHLMKEL